MYQAGQRTGDYEVLEVLGAGAMGKVYKVRNVLSDRVEAMKVLLPNLEASPELGERFLREIKVQATLQHKNIAQLHTAQRDGQKMLMLIEYVDGITLETALERTRISTELVVNIVLQVLEALAYAHSRGVIHRDIKPANIMLTRDGVAKLMDFGIARLNNNVGPAATKEGKTVGSLYYMSPEQIRGAADLDQRSDYYSLGVMLYEMATGQRPFEGDSEYSIMIGHLQTPPRPPVEVDPRVPPGLNDIILRAIVKEREHRFQTAEEFARALRGAFGLPSAARTAAESTTLYDRMRPVGGAPAGVAPQAPVYVHQQEAPPPVAAQPANYAPPPPAMPQPPSYVAQTPVTAAYAPPPQAVKPSSGKGLLIATALLGVTAVSGGGYWYWKSTQPKTDLYVKQDSPGGESGRPAATMPTATQNPAPAATQATPPAQTPEQTPVATQPAAASTPPRRDPPVEVAQAPQQQRASQAGPLTDGGVPPSAPPSAPAPAPQPAASPVAPAPQNAAQLEAVRKRYNNMAIQFATAKDGVATLEAQMKSQGLGLRADIKQLANRGDYLMKEAMDSIVAGNAAAANDTLDQARLVLDALKRFLNQ